MRVAPTPLVETQVSPVTVRTEKKEVIEHALVIEQEVITEEPQPATSMTEDALLFFLLRQAFSQWQGTPYRFGGNSYHGIDCSALVQNIFHESFNIKLPRTTETQVKLGFHVYRDELQIGDLVFFKTGRNSRHVGIYIGNNEFIHASTSKGVITSSLDNVYWKPRYWQAKRIIN